MDFSFATANRIIFGWNCSQQLPQEAAALGKIVLLVCGANPQRHAQLHASLEAAGLSVLPLTVRGEPDTALIQMGTELGRKEKVQLVIGLGGGSAIDTAKALAALIPASGQLMDHLEVVGAGRPLDALPLPCIAVPTTAGTGAEVTRNAVIEVEHAKVKVSLRSPLMLPQLALVDPQLTCSCPPAVTAASGLDALTQLIEPLVCSRANPVTDALCREGIPRMARYLRQCYHHGHDKTARQELALGSLFGGLALANAGLGAVHGFAGPLGGTIGAAHGAICASLLPHVMAANIRALKQRQPESAALARYDEVGRLLTGSSEANADEAIEWVTTLTRDLAIPGLHQLGMETYHIDQLIENASRSSSMKANPLQLQMDELRAIIAAAW